MSLLKYEKIFSENDISIKGKVRFESAKYSSFVFYMRQIYIKRKHFAESNFIMKLA